MARRKNSLARDSHCYAISFYCFCPTSVSVLWRICVYIKTFLTQYRSYKNYRYYQIHNIRHIKLGFQLYTPTIFTLQETLLLIISVWGWDKRRILLRLEGLCQIKILMTRWGIERATFRLVAQPNALPRRINYVIVIRIKDYNARIIIMEDCKILFCPSKFP